MKRRIAFAMALTMVLTSVPTNGLVGYAMEPSEESAENLSVEWETDAFSEQENEEFDEEEFFGEEMEVIPEESGEESGEQLVEEESVQAYANTGNEIAVQNEESGAEANIQFEETTTYYRPELGDTVTLSSKATANLSLTYQWYKLNQEKGEYEAIEGEKGKGETYTVESVDGNATYCCEVTAENGECRGQTFSIYVQTLKVAYDELESNVQAAYGKETELYLPVTSSYGDIKYTWYKVVSENESDGTREMEELSTTGARLKVTNVTEKQKYFCRADDGNDSTWIEFLVTVDTGVKFKNNGDQSFYEKPGQSITLDAEAEANPGVELQYQWYEEKKRTEGWYEWQPVTGATSPSYDITVGLHYARYLCRVTDSYGGTYEKPFSISVKTLSTGLDETYQDVRVLPGESAELKVVVSSELGDDQITYEWQKYNEDTNDYETLSEEKGNAITVTNIEKDEKYRCIVSDGNQTECYDFDVKIETKLELKEYDESISVEPGQNAELKVEAETNYGKLTYQWQINERNSEGEWEWMDIQGAIKPEYTVENVIKDVTYRCHVSNGYRDDYADYHINVNSGLQVEGFDYERDWVELGKDCPLEVKATTKYGTLTYQWEKWNEEKDDYEKIEGATSDRYIVENVRSHENYLCVISNGYEERERYFEVYVDSGFKVTYEEDVKVKSGEKVTLKVDAESNYELKYQWYEGEEWDSTIIDGATDAVYEVTKEGSESQYYCCKVSDPYNSKMAEFCVSLDSGFSYTADTEVWVPEGEDAELKVNATTYEEYGPLKYTWYEIIDADYWIELPQETGDTYVVRNVTGLKTYLCKVENKEKWENVYFLVGSNESRDSLALGFASAKTFEENGKNMVQIPMYRTNMYFKFVPSRTGVWKIYSDSYSDTQAWLYDADRNLIEYDDDGRGEHGLDYYDGNFCISQYLEQGVTYYIACGYNGNDEMGEFPVYAKYDGSGEHEHQWDAGVITEQPTCEKNGTIVFTCSVCGGKYNAPAFATGHNYDAYVTTTWPTVIAAGTETRTCLTCGHTEYRELAKLPGTIRLTTAKLPLQVKKSVQLSRIVTDLAAGDYIASCVSSNPKAATVTNTGNVTGKAAGTTTITITLASGVTAKVTVTVQKKTVTTSSIGNISKTWNAKIGEKKQLSPIISPITTKDKVSYSSSNKKVATVSRNGLITAKKAGTAKITVKSGKKKVTVTVKVAKTAPTGMNGVPASKSLKKKKSFTIKPKLTPAGAEAKITYSSSNKKVATVNSKGKVTAKGSGTAVITVKAGSVTRTCTVTVK